MVDKNLIEECENKFPDGGVPTKYVTVLQDQFLYSIEHKKLTEIKAHYDRIAAKASELEKAAIFMAVTSHFKSAGE